MYGGSLAGGAARTRVGARRGRTKMKGTVPFSRAGRGRPFVIGEMGDDAGVARRRRVFLGACVPVFSLARGPPPGFGIVAASTFIRFVCFGGSYGRVSVDLGREVSVGDDL